MQHEHRRVVLAGLHGPVTVLLRWWATPAEKARAIHWPGACGLLDEVMRSSAQELASIYALLWGAPPRDLDARSAWETRQRILDAARDGQLLVIREWTSIGDIHETSPGPRKEPPLPEEARTASFVLELVDGLDGTPLAGVPLRIRRPRGDTAIHKTDAGGSVRIAGVELGDCEITSVIDQARVATSYVPKIGVAAGARVATATARTVSAAAHILDVVRHRVATGETPASIARRWNLSWTEIAAFNWGTQDPAQLEACFRDELGCTKKRDDGQGYRFDDTDEPGVILIPVPWESRLQVGPVHRIRVDPLRTLYVSLENEHGIGVPGARFVLRFADGTERRGSLGRAGIARLDGVPDAAFAISYPEQADVLARSLAASVRKAFDDQATGPLFHLLGQERAIVDRAKEVYETFFNDLSGEGLVADIDQVVTDPEARAPLLYFCALAGLKVEGVDEVMLPKEPPPPGW